MQTASWQNLDNLGAQGPVSTYSTDQFQHTGKKSTRQSKSSRITFGVVSEHEEKLVVWE